jgi:hypothetical protein
MAQVTTQTTGISEDMRLCTQNCLECYAICVQTLQYCLQKGGKYAEASHIRLLEDCAAICQTSAGFMLRGSPLHVLTCGACAEVCLRCAESCERIADDTQLRACADLCRRCADSCKRLTSPRS